MMSPPWALGGYGLGLTAHSPTDPHRADIGLSLLPCTFLDIHSDKSHTCRKLALNAPNLKPPSSPPRHTSHTTKPREERGDAAGGAGVCKNEPGPFQYALSHWPRPTRSAPCVCTSTTVCTPAANTVHSSHIFHHASPARTHCRTRWFAAQLVVARPACAAARTRGRAQLGSQAPPASSVAPPSFHRPSHAPASPA
jgi:hypothetical protein